MERARVLEIISGFAVEGPLGGIERFGMALSQALDRTRFEPVVCGLWTYGTPFEPGWLDYLHQRGIQAFIAADWNEAAPYKSFYQAVLGVRRQIGGDVDIIHSHCQFGDGVALLLKRALGARAMIRTVHNEREWGKRPGRRLLLTNLLFPLLFDLEMGVSQQVVDNLNQRPITRLLGRRAAVLYNAIDFERFLNVQVDPQVKRASLGLPPQAFVVGSIGRLMEQKGYEYLLDAVPAVLARFPDTYFLIIGNGYLHESLQRQAQALRIADRVIFTGARQDVEELLSIMDVFVNCSLWEGLPTALMESMVMRVPIVATDVSGTRELIEPDVSGKLVPPAEPEALARAIVEMRLASPAVTMKIIDRAYRQIQERFSIEAVAQQHQALYCQLIS